MKKEKHGEGLVVSDTICPTTTAGQGFPSPREEKVAEALLYATRGIAARPVQNAKRTKNEGVAMDLSARRAQLQRAPPCNYSALAPPVSRMIQPPDAPLRYT